MSECALEFGGKLRFHVAFSFCMVNRNIFFSWANIKQTAIELTRQRLYAKHWNRDVYSGRQLYNVNTVA